MMGTRGSLSQVVVVVLVVGLGLLVACSATSSGDAMARAAAVTGGTVRTAPVGFSCPDAAQHAGEDRGGPPTGSKLEVVTTVAPITSIVANIAGDRANVTGVIPEGEDSHTYEPKPSAAAVLSEADLVFVNGLMLEDPTTDLAATNGKDGSQVLELGQLTITEDEYLYDVSFPKDAGKPNPHLWTNPPMARCYAAIVTSAMAKADPINAPYYRDNFTAYARKLDQLDQLMKDASSKMTPQQRKLLTYHDAYAYFAKHYGWTVVGAIQVSNFEEPTAKEVAELIDQVGAEQVPAIFGSEVFPSPVLEQIGKEAGVEYVDTLRDDDLPGAPGDPEHSFLGLMKFDFVTMVASLGGDPSGLRAFDDRDVVIDQAEYPQ